MKSKEANTGCNLGESSKEGHGSKMAVLPMMVMMMIQLLPCFESVTFMEFRKQYVSTHSWLELMARPR